MSIFIGMAAQPRRFPNLETSLPILAKQCDKLWLVINPDVTKNVEVPTPILPKCLDNLNNVEVIINGKNLGDKEKFIGMQYQKKGYFFSVDDDILYPLNYVEKHIENMFQIENWGITCVHASTFNALGDLINFTGHRKMYHFEWPHLKREKVLIPGTGTACYEVSKFTMFANEMPVANMADIWIACKAAQRGVPVYTIQRPSGWLKGMRSYGEAISEGRPIKEMDEVVKANKAHFQKMYKRLIEI